MTETALLNDANQYAPVNLADMPSLDNVADFNLTPADTAFMHDADVAAAGIDLSRTVEPQDPFGLRARNAVPAAGKFDHIDLKAPAPYSIPQAGPVTVEPGFKVSVPTAEQMAAEEEAKFLSYAADAAKVAVAAYTEKQAAKEQEEEAAAAAHATVVQQGKAMQRFLIEEDEKKPALVG